MSLPPSFVAAAEAPVPIYLVGSAAWDSGLSLPDDLAAMATAQGFKAGSGETVLSATSDGTLSGVLYGLGKGGDALAVAGLSAKLKAGAYEIAAQGGLDLAQIAAGWADGAYRFDRYLSKAEAPPSLVIGTGADSEAIAREASAIIRLRDMVNTPAEDMGPEAIEAQVRDVA
ncbi:MAG: leucyl aminopeptidase family protein, partial [Pseudomonadota bacterium]